MNKKIKMLIQKYDKDMKFENRFDELKDKLDLIPEADIKSEVFTIKRKVMPAYMMMIVLLMLITGIIGLQFGLNSSFVVGPEQIDKVEEKLATLADVYVRESTQTLYLEDSAKLNIYIGIRNNNKVIIIFGEAKEATDEILVTHSNIDYVIAYGDNYVVVEVFDESNIELTVTLMNNEVTKSQRDFTIDLSSDFEYFGY